MPRETISSPNAPAAVGPYAQAVKTDAYIFMSGQIPLNPTTGELIADDVAAQTEQVFANIKAVLAAAGKTLSDVQKTTVFLIDMADFAAMNAVYATHFEAPYPARSTIAVAALPKGARVEIECIVQ